MRYIILLLVLVNVAACGASEPTQTEVADKLASDTLSLDAQEECNDKGNFYDNTRKKCTKHDLAAWKCSRAGLLERMRAEQNEDMGDFGDKLDDGWKFHQCGEASNGDLYVIIKKQQTQDEVSTIEATLYIFPGE